MKRPLILSAIVLLIGVSLLRAAETKPLVYDVRASGATGDGKTLDTPAINKAIETANGAGGGTVYFPAGTYLCYSIHLKSNVALYLDQGATILAAPNPLEEGAPGYDMLSDVVGAKAYHEGKAQDISGISTDGDVLRIRLVAVGRDRRLGWRRCDASQHQHTACRRARGGHDGSAGSRDLLLSVP